MNLLSFFTKSHPTKMRIVLNGHPALRQKSEPVEALTEDIRMFADRLLVSLQESEVPGVGLAAPQVGVNLRMIAIDTRPSGNDIPSNLSQGEIMLNPRMPMVLVNPEILSVSEETETLCEGCLSLPGIDGEVKRPVSVLLKATLMDGSHIVAQCGNLLARCLQHEIDHLDGVLFIDRAPRDQQKEAEHTMKLLKKRELKLEENEK